jgi:GAF domain-containing protein
MKFPWRPSGEQSQQKINVVLQRLARSKDVEADLSEVLDVAIGMTGADMGTLQRFDDADDLLQIAASRGFSEEALAFFRQVRRDTNTTCAVALTRRMQVFVGDVSESYLFVGSPELEVLRRLGIAAVQSTPLIGSTGRFWGVVSTHFRKPQVEGCFDHLSLNRLAFQVANSLEQWETSASNANSSDEQAPLPMERP